jgi:hypothetical protein
MPLLSPRANERGPAESKTRAAVPAGAIRPIAFRHVQELAIRVKLDCTPARVGAGTGRFHRRPRLFRHSTSILCGNRFWTVASR